MEESYYRLNVYLIVVLPQSNKSQYEWMLHLNLIDQNVFTPRIDIGIEQQRSRNGAEEEHIEEDEEDEEELKPLGNFESEELVIGKWVVAAADIDVEDHVSEVVVVVGELVDGCCFWHFD